jgi:general secretion pathway protein H
MHMRSSDKFRSGSQGRSAGFTLIEILVTIIIIGVIVSAATLSMGVLGRDSEVEDQSRRFWAVLRQAREESEIQGLDVGVQLTPTEYAFQRFDQRNTLWQPIEFDKLYAPRKLPEGLRLRVWIDGREIVLKPPPKQSERKDLLKESKDLFKEAKDQNGDGKPDIDRSKLPPPPQIVVLASGEIMPFEMQIERDGAPSLWRVVAQPDNDLRVERRVDKSEWQVVAQTLPPSDEKPKSGRKTDARLK